MRKQRMFTVARCRGIFADVHRRSLEDERDSRVYEFVFQSRRFVSFSSETITSK